jgi:carbamoylphosphate synthase large subunit
VQLKVLIASTTWFALPARVAVAFAKAGAHVSGIVPRGNPLSTVKSLKANFRYSAMNPQRSLAEAIKAVQPDLIIPCDDRVVEHLHELHAQQSGPRGDATICALIEQSLGSPSGYDTSKSRGHLLQLAESLGVRIPKTGIIHKLDDLRTWLREHGYPSVLKVDGTWGGTGVRIVRSWEEAEQAFLQLTRPISSMAMLRFISNHDFFPFFAKAKSNRTEITIQRYIDGKSANTMFACWQGKVLDDLSVETVFAVDPLGSSTIVRTIADPEMSRAGRVLVENLAMSGFCGLDFIIETSTGNVYLIEMNPRATQIGHLEPGGAPSLVRTLCRGFEGEVTDKPAFAQQTIAFFPHFLRCGPDTNLPNLSTMHQDIPWEEPKLIRELVKKPWNRRHLSSMLYTVIQRIIEPAVTKLPQKADKGSVPKDARPRH